MASRSLAGAGVAGAACTHMLSDNNGQVVTRHRLDARRGHGNPRDSLIVSIRPLTRRSHSSPVLSHTPLHLISGEPRVGDLGWASVCEGSACRAKQVAHVHAPPRALYLPLHGWRCAAVSRATTPRQAGGTPPRPPLSTHEPARAASASSLACVMLVQILHERRVLLVGASQPPPALINECNTRERTSLCVLIGLHNQRVTHTTTSAHEGGGVSGRVCVCVVQILMYREAEGTQHPCHTTHARCCRPKLRCRQQAHGSVMAGLTAPPACTHTHTHTHARTRTRTPHTQRRDPLPAPHAPRLLHSSAQRLAWEHTQATGRTHRATRRAQRAVAAAARSHTRTHKQYERGTSAAVLPLLLSAILHTQTCART
jgi:hypothetical protein